jgi:nitroreductase
MFTKKRWIGAAIASILLICTVSLAAEDLKAIKLPSPETSGGKPLLQAIANRTTIRQYSSRKLPLQLLSNLLWAASGKVPDAVSGATARTPSAMGWNNVELYLATSDGVYRYDREAHVLNPVKAGDIRGVTALQPDVAEAAVILIYVADYRADLMTFDPNVGGYVPAPQEVKVYYSDLGTCFIAENVYLFCASEGLATVFRSSIDRRAIAQAIQLAPNQAVTHVQSVGYARQ